MPKQLILSGFSHSELSMNEINQIKRNIEINGYSNRKTDDKIIMSKDKFKQSLLCKNSIYGSFTLD